MRVDYIGGNTVGVYLEADEITRIRSGEGIGRTQIWVGSAGIIPRSIRVEHSMNSYVKHFPPHVELKNASTICVGVSTQDLEEIARSAEIALSV